MNKVILRLGAVMRERNSDIVIQRCCYWCLQVRYLTEFMGVIDQA